jgi:superfamily I DNA/RNA helicase
MPASPPTPQQAAFLAHITHGAGHSALVARAGCGKTSTILMAVDAIRSAQPRAEVLVCAFNKAIADEVKAKLEKAGHRDWRLTSASTLHSLGYGLVRFVFHNPDIDDKKVRRLVDARNEPICEHYGSQVEQLVALAKQAGVGFFPGLPVANVQVWHDLADHFDVNGLDDTQDMEAIVEAAQVVYRASLAQTDVIDYDDMILFPLIKNLRVKFGKDHIFLDEAQDLSRTRQALARKFLRPGGRMHVVGDDRQAIYGFTGADASALPNLISALSATVLPLSVTWRCPKAVVALAQSLVPDIEAAPGAPEGEVSAMRLPATPPKPGEADPEAEWLAQLTTQDAILCRNMMPLVSLAYKLIRSGKPCKVEGRNIGEGLIALARRWKVKSLDALVTRLETYQDREVQKAMAKLNEAKAEEVQDRVGTMMEIINACRLQGKTLVTDVVAFIENLFADGATNVTVLATYHRSKGREWPRVYLWEHDTRCPSKMARQPWQRAQEENLAYVAFTRAQQALVFVS